MHYYLSMAKRLFIIFSTVEVSLSRVRDTNSAVYPNLVMPHYFRFALYNQFWCCVKWIKKKAPRLARHATNTVSPAHLDGYFMPYFDKNDWSECSWGYRRSKKRSVFSERSHLHTEHISLKKAFLFWNAMAMACRYFNLHDYQDIKVMLKWVFLCSKCIIKL